MNPPGVPVEHNYRCRGLGIQVNSYFNEISEEHGPARGRAEEGGREGVLGRKKRETGRRTG